MSSWIDEMMDDEMEVEKDDSNSSVDSVVDCDDVDTCEDEDSCDNRSNDIEKIIKHIIDSVRKIL